MSQLKLSKKMITIVAILITFIIIILVWGGYKFLKHEQNQSDLIEQLQQDMTALQSEFDAKDTVVDWDEDSYNYLAIGNSITKHPLCDYWWNEIGMAASAEDKDYFHIVSAYLKKQIGNVQTFASGSAAWEITSTDRVQTLSIYDNYLSDKLDLVTIELSENVSDLTTFESDFREMVEYVSERCPNAQIIVIDDFWSDEKSELKKRAIEGLDVDFVGLSEIRSDSKYQAGMGTVVYDSDGESHIIEHDGVAMHPGDEGMEYYAEKIIELLDI